MTTIDIPCDRHQTVAEYTGIPRPLAKELFKFLQVNGYRLRIRFSDYFEAPVLYAAWDWQSSFDHVEGAMVEPKRDGCYLDFRYVKGRVKVVKCGLEFKVFSVSTEVVMGWLVKNLSAEALVKREYPELFPEKLPTP